MSRRIWKHRITDIIDSIKKILKYVEKMEFDDFQKDEKTIDAVIRNFIVIGEAARHVPDEISSKYPNIPYELWAICATLPSMSTGALNCAQYGKPSKTTFHLSYPA